MLLVLRARRVERGLTQAQLGAKIGVSAKQMARYELGEAMPPSPVAGRLADELGLSRRKLDQILEEMKAAKQAQQAEPNPGEPEDVSDRQAAAHG